MDRITTPSGTLSWANLRTQETWQGKPTGKFSITQKLSLEDTEALLKQLEAHYNEIKKYAPCFKGMKPAKGSSPNFGTKEDQNGDTVFKFSTQAVGKNSKTGETWNKVVPVFDAAGKHLEVNIGNGSTGKVAFTIGPKFKDSKTYGLNLYLEAVQVTNLVQYQPGAVQAESFGFDSEEPSEDEENPFDTDRTDEQPGDDTEDF